MPRRCAIGCKPTRGVLHVFPNPNKFPEQFKAWVRIVSGKDECDFDYKKMRICDKHFTERDRNRNNRLNALAVPSLLLHGSYADVPMQNEQSASTNIMSEKSLGQPEVSDNNQSTSDNVADVQTQIKAGFPISTMCEQSAGQTDSHQCALDQSPEVSFNPLVEHNYCKLSKEHHKIKSWKSNLSSVGTSKKYRVYQQKIKNLRREVYRLRKQRKDIKSRLENAEKLLNNLIFKNLEKI